MSEMKQFNQVAVIGAGVMGAGIAAHMANAGVKVILFDIVPKDASPNDSKQIRTKIAMSALTALNKSDPAAFTHPKFAKLVTPANLEDDLELLKTCDLVIEAIIENRELKRTLYAKLTPFLKKDVVLSSNTSTIPLDELTKDLDPSLKKSFVITHFFNPPRYMPLLELVVTKDTDKALVQAISDFFDITLGKRVILCNDRPGFIGNRLGIFWIMTAMQAAIDQNMTIEDADAVLSKPIGVPKTGVFGLADLVGIDLMPHVLGSMQMALPASDPMILGYRPMALVKTMLDKGLSGRKGKGGFYRLERKSDGSKEKQAIDLATGEYRKQEKSVLESAKHKPKELLALLKDSDVGGKYARTVMLRTLAYAAFLVPDVTDNIADIDAAMRLGYRWKYGPFELMDMIGVDALISLLEADGIEVPAFLSLAKGGQFYQTEEGTTKRLTLTAKGKSYAPILHRQGVISLSDIKKISKPLLKNGSASLWDIGEGVACFEFTSFMNSFDGEIMALLNQTVKEFPKLGMKALVIYNEGDNFSVGANLGLALFAANIAAWEELENTIVLGQKTYQKLKYAPFPVIGAPAGMALGGGCEILLHCDALQAHIESYIGLVEVGVGIVPGWGGCAQMLARWKANKHLPNGPMPATAKVFETLATATVAKSAELARDYLFLRPHDRISMNRERQLYDARELALSMVKDYQPQTPPTYRLPGASGVLALTMAAEALHRQGVATDHDITVAKELAFVLCGGDKDVTDEITENEILKLEQVAIGKLFRHPKTLARIEHTLETGKPLRN